MDASSLAICLNSHLPKLQAADDGDVEGV